MQRDILKCNNRIHLEFLNVVYAVEYVARSLRCAGQTETPFRIRMCPRYFFVPMPIRCLRHTIVTSAQCVTLLFFSTFNRKYTASPKGETGETMQGIFAQGTRHELPHILCQIYMIDEITRNYCYSCSGWRKLIRIYTTRRNNRHINIRTRN